MTARVKNCVTGQLMTAALCSFALTACSSSETQKEQTTHQQASSAMAEQENAPIKEVAMQQLNETHTGTIVYKNFEGGFYAFENKSGARFTLMGLKPEFKKHGLLVEIQGTPIRDVMTTTQFGVPFKLDSIRIIDASKVKDSANM